MNWFWDHVADHHRFPAAQEIGREKRAEAGDEHQNVPARMPGVQSGTVIRVSVDQGFAPRSAAASSRLVSMRSRVRTAAGP